jgi:hypothetical protein
MKLTRAFLGFTLIFSLGFISFVSLPIQTAIAQENSVALQRGYRTGYSDGYMAGYRDAIDTKSKDFKSHPEYSDANRAYNKDFGTIEEYSDGYRQGFEAGYDTGFEKRGFDATIPTDLHRRDTTLVAEQPATQDQTPATVETQKISYSQDGADSVTIPRDMELILELQEDISTEKNKPGDRFTARVVSPSEIAGATIEGRVDKIQKPGRIKRRSELSLTFDRLVMNENRWGNIAATLTEVLPIKGDNVKLVDAEGTAVGKSSIKGDTIKVGSATGTGTVIGAVAGGPVGAAVGAGVGAAFGVGAVVIQRGKHVNLIKNQQLRIKTDLETRIR